jgi:hypothetical protein
MTNDQLLTELERREKYLAELPANFNFPLFNTKCALESQRQNGYRNSAVAVREIVDNSLEAKADKVHVVFDLFNLKWAQSRYDPWPLDVVSSPHSKWQMCYTMDS